MRPFSTGHTTERAYGPERAGAGVVDIVMATVVIVIVFTYALGTIFHNKQTVTYTERVDNLRTLRQIVASVSRDLESATEIIKPAYGTSSYELVFRDDRYRLIRFVMSDEANARLTTDAQIHDELDKPNYLVRIEESDDPAQGRRIARMCRRLHYVRFCRIGGNMVGIVVRLKKTSEKPGEERTLLLDTLVTINNVIK